MHPRFHNQNDLTKRLQSLLEKISDKPIPQFHLYSKTVFAGKPNKAQRISASAIHIECESNNLFELCELFHKLYSSTKNVLPRKFIPMNIPHLQNQSTYSNIIHQQHLYLENHQNITISKISSEDLQIKINQHDNKSIYSVLESSPNISWISLNSSDQDKMKWNLSTTSTNFIPACKLIKQLVLHNLPSSKANIPELSDTI